jgi:hypothetical protein
MVSDWPQWQKDTSCTVADTSSAQFITAPNLHGATRGLQRPATSCYDWDLEMMHQTRLHIDYLIHDNDTTTTRMRWRGRRSGARVAARRYRCGLLDSRYWLSLDDAGKGGQDKPCSHTPHVRGSKLPGIKDVAECPKGHPANCSYQTV